jgi:hypothetical protein
MFQDLTGTVNGAVIYEDDLPGMLSGERQKRRDNDLQVFSFIEGRHDDCQLVFPGHVANVGFSAVQIYFLFSCRWIAVVQ